MRQTIKSLSYILILGWVAWFAAYVTDLFIGSVRFTAAGRAPGDITNEGEWASLLFSTFIIAVGIAIISLFFSLIGKTRLHPVILYGIPILAILYYALCTFFVTVGHSV